MHVGPAVTGARRCFVPACFFFRRLEVMGGRKNGARLGATRIFLVRPVFSRAHYFPCYAKRGTTNKFSTIHVIFYSQRNKK